MRFGSNLVNYQEIRLNYLELALRQKRAAKELFKRTVTGELFGGAA